ncbi:Hypothetical protein FKW44_011138 [Caligus rogercresseyi]|uniref:Uncharacterized protein n=1 Tax=Caligus rogercresseyi TaxID=217165 RepID=A0A7T8HHP8_CALRO|nr:Hypothetical protein FKW44_011138 [Caligus rogercresseyi]
MTPAYSSYSYWAWIKPEAEARAPRKLHGGVSGCINLVGAGKAPALYGEFHVLK